MKLDAKQIDDLKKHFIAKWRANYSCTMCNQTNFSINDMVVELRDFNQNGGMVISAGAPVMPVVAVTCDNCGHVELVSPLVAGIKL